MKPSRLVRRRIHAQAVGDLTILERGDVVSDAEFAARGPRPADIVTCAIVVRHESLGDERGVIARPMRLRIPRQWLERSFGQPTENDTNTDPSEPEAIAVGDVTIIDSGRLARLVGTGHANSAPGWLRDTRQRIAGDLRNAPLPVLARLAGVHPVHLSRMFRRVFGTTITNVRQTLKLQRATQAIVCSSRTIAQIAADHGFADQGHLTRALRKAAGLTPGYLRRKAQNTEGRSPRGGAE